MYSLQTQETPKTCDRATSQFVQPVSTPAVDQIVKAICADACQDALKYAIRSDTGHDGE